MSLKKILILVLVFCFLPFQGSNYSEYFSSGQNTLETSYATELSETTKTPDPTQTVNITDTPSPTASPEPTPTQEPYTEIVIGAAGDIMCHIRQVNDAYDAAGDGSYSFYHWFDYIKEALKYPDLMIANLEAPLGGEETGYNGYPMFNFPDEIVPALLDAGIDVVLNANNHIMDRYVEGVERTIDVLDSYGMLHTGAWKSAEDKSVPLVIDVNGIKVGVISATYSLNGLEGRLDEETLDYLVCYIDKEQVKERIELCREYGAEVIVVCPHMGDELETQTRRGIREYAEAYIEMGADIVFASHPHVVQPVETYEAVLEDGTTHSGIIYYSLGNLVSGQYGVIKEVGAIGYVTVRRDNSTGEIEITAAQYMPVYTLRYGESGNLYHVLPLGYCLDNIDFIVDLEPSSYIISRMEIAWEKATEIMGTEPAELIKYIP